MVTLPIHPVFLDVTEDDRKDDSPMVGMTGELTELIVAVAVEYRDNVLM